MGSKAIGQRPIGYLGLMNRIGRLALLWAAEDCELVCHRSGKPPEDGRWVYHLTSREHVALAFPRRSPDRRARPSRTRGAGRGTSTGEDGRES
jgi:hypothetical protein